MNPWTLAPAMAFIGTVLASPGFAADTSHWSFQPVREPAVPQIAAARNPVDAFVIERLRRAGLDLAPPAERAALVRRLYLDMHGLVPSPETVAGFEGSDDPAAYEVLVEQVLASPRYGERWAQHWLDTVRYADTHGFEVNT